MRVHAELLTARADDCTGTTILVHFDDKRYMFGQISEGTQRAIQERSSRTGRLAEIFLSGRTDWSTMGGLVGLVLTIGDQTKHNEKASGITVHGGDNLLYSIAATRSFVLREMLKLKLDEISDENQEFRDDHVVISPMRIRPENGSPRRRGSLSAKDRKRSYDDAREDERMDTLRKKVENMFWTEQKSVNAPPNLDEINAASEYEAFKPVAEKRIRSASPGKDEPIARPISPTGGFDKLPRGKPSSVAMSYIMMMHDHRGKFLPQKAKELGVTPGPNFAKLTRGESVTTKNGKVVTPEEVMEPSNIGTGIAVIDLPDASYLTEFLAHRQWQDLEEKQRRLGAFFWIFGDGEMHKDPRLVEFIAKFPNAKHTITSPSISKNQLMFKGAAKFTYRLNKVDPDFFPLSQFSDEPISPPPPGAVAGEWGYRRIIEPAWDDEFKALYPVFDPEEAFTGLRKLGPEFDNTCSAIQASFQAAPFKPSTFPGSDAEVFTLGTGSAVPSRYRNVSSTLIKVPGVGGIMLDCGENTIGQLRRLFPSAELTETLKSLRVLYISHLHADHHLGSVSVLKAQTKLVPRSQKIYVVAPFRFNNFLKEHCSVEDFGIDRIVFIPCEQIRQRGKLAYPRDLEAFLTEMKLKQWTTAYAVHCQSAFTTAFEFENGFKVAYSGDTRPTREFVEIGRGATLVVHEATFDDELQGEAIAKRHCTMTEAVTAARGMKAKVCCLTHFSQRYPKKPKMDVAVGDSANLDGEAYNGPDVVYAFDCMKFRVGEAGKFGRLMKGIEEVYADVGEDGTSLEDDVAYEAADVEEMCEPLVEEKKTGKGKKEKEKKKEKKEKKIE